MTTQISETTQTIQEDGLVVTKTVEGETFDVPAIMYQVVSARSDMTEFSLYDEIPGGHSRADIGFHPKYGKSNWSVDGPELIYEDDVDAGEELYIAYGVRDTTVSELAERMTTPTLEVHGPPPEVESLEDVIPGVEATNGSQSAVADDQWRPSASDRDRLLDIVADIPDEQNTYYLRVPLDGSDPETLERNVANKAAGLDVLGSVATQRPDGDDTLDAVVCCDHAFDDLQTALEMVLDRPFELADFDEYTDDEVEPAASEVRMDSLEELSRELSLPRWDDIGATATTPETVDDEEPEMPEAIADGAAPVEDLGEEFETEPDDTESEAEVVDEEEPPEAEADIETPPEPATDTSDESDAFEAVEPVEESPETATTEPETEPDESDASSEEEQVDAEDSTADLLARLESGDVTDEERERIIAALEGDDDTEPSKLSSLQSTVGEYATYVDAIEGFTRTAESVLAELDAEFDTIDAKLESLEPDSDAVMSALENAQSGLADDLKGVAGDIEEIESRVDGRIAEVGDDVAAVKRDVRDIRARHAELAERIDTIEDAFQTHRSEVRDELDGVRADVDRVRTDASDVRSELSAAIESIRADVDANTRWREQLSQVIAAGRPEE